MGATVARNSREARTTGWRGGVKRATHRSAALLGGAAFVLSAAILAGALTRVLAQFR